MNLLQKRPYHLESLCASTRHYKTHTPRQYCVLIYSFIYTQTSTCNCGCHFKWMCECQWWMSEIQSLNDMHYKWMSGCKWWISYIGIPLIGTTCIYPQTSTCNGGYHLVTKFLLQQKTYHLNFCCKRDPVISETDMYHYKWTSSSDWISVAKEPL